MTQTTTTPPLPARSQGLVSRECGCRLFLTVYTRPRSIGIVRSKRCRNRGKAITTRGKMFGASDG